MTDIGERNDSLSPTAVPDMLRLAEKLLPLAAPAEAAWAVPLLQLGERMLRANLTPQHVARIDIARLHALEAGADSRLDALAAEHDSVFGCEHAAALIAAGHSRTCANGREGDDPTCKACHPGMYPEEQQ